MRLVSPTVLLATAFLAFTAQAKPDCERLDREANELGHRIPGYLSGRNVIGSGKLQFYAAPNVHCQMAGVFVLPGQTVDAYVEHEGFTFVMYINLKTKEDAEGWVLSSRLKSNGYGIAPRQ